MHVSEAISNPLKFDEFFNVRHYSEYVEVYRRRETLGAEAKLCF